MRLDLRFVESRRAHANLAQQAVRLTALAGREDVDDIVVAQTVDLARVEHESPGAHAQVHAPSCWRSGPDLCGGAAFARGAQMALPHRGVAGGDQPCELVEAD